MKFLMKTLNLQASSFTSLLLLRFKWETPIGLKWLN